MIQVSPKRAGELIVNPASVSYRDDDEDSEKRVTKVAADDTLVVEELTSYKRRTDRHGTTWVIYFAASLLLTAGPFGVSHVMIKSLSPSAVPTKKL